MLDQGRNMCLNHNDTVTVLPIYSLKFKEKQRTKENVCAWQQRVKDVTYSLSCFFHVPDPQCEKNAIKSFVLQRWKWAERDFSFLPLLDYLRTESTSQKRPIRSPIHVTAFLSQNFESTFYINVKYLLDLLCLSNERQGLSLGSCIYNHLLSLKFCLMQAHNRFLNIKCMQRSLFLCIAFAHATHSALCF